MALTTEQRLQQLEVTVALLEASIKKVVLQMNNTASKTTVNRAIAYLKIEIETAQNLLTQLQNNLEIHFEQTEIQ